MRKFRKKKGSSLIMVVCITAIIFTTATSMIALVTSDYKHRINESKRVENSYQAESGLGIISNVITKDSDAAIVYANAKVREYIKNETGKNDKRLIGGTSDAIYQEINGVFKAEFINFLGNTKFDAVNPGSGLNNENAPYQHLATNLEPRTDETLIFSILNNEYLELKKGASASETERLSNVTKNETNYSYKWTKIERPIEALKQEAKIEILSYIVKPKESITIVVNSTFNTKSQIDGTINKKSVSRKFIVNAPDYSQQMNASAQPVKVDKYPIAKAIVTDGNLNVMNTNSNDKFTVNVTGDVWAQGTMEASTGDIDYAYQKYKAGIFIKNATFNVHGNVYTPSTFNLINEATSTVDNNLYALNVYEGPKEKSDTSSNNSLTVNNTASNNEILTNNDLTLNSLNSTMSIANYYGINDITANTKGLSIAKQAYAKQSSSIIVNKTNKNPSISIGTAYVMGVSYINTDGNDAYGTGESVGIKGNYMAYTDKIPGSNDEKEFKMYSPLYLAYKTISTDKEMTKEEKANYFKKYYNSDQKNFIIDVGGVSINTLYAIGAFPSGVINNTTETASIHSPTPDVLNTIENKKRDFAKQVFLMGALANDNKVAYSEANYSTIYTENEVKNTVKDRIEWTKKEYIPPVTSGGLADAEGKLIYHVNENDKENTSEIRVSKDGIIVNGKTINAKLDGKGDYQFAVIITYGKVTIEDDAKFKGTIIAHGDVNIEGDADVQYDEPTVLGITGKYTAEMNGLLKGAPLNQNGQITITASKALETPGLATSGYSDAKYDADVNLKYGLWKIEK